VIVTEDSLSSNAPHIETLQDHHMQYILLKDCTKMALTPL
jgi:hypothetical protein